MHVHIQKKQNYRQERRQTHSYSKRIDCFSIIVPLQFSSCLPPLLDKLSPFFSKPLSCAVPLVLSLPLCLLVHCVDRWCTMWCENLHTPVCCFCFPAMLWSSAGLSPVCAGRLETRCFILLFFFSNNCFMLMHWAQTSSLRISVVKEELMLHSIPPHALFLSIRRMSVN